MQPAPPAASAATRRSLCPDTAANWLGSNCVATLVILEMFPHVNFTAAIFSCLPSVSSISESTSSPDNKFGKL